MVRARTSDGTSEHRPLPILCDKVKLPKLILRPFNGEMTAWTTFWESFDSSIHSNRDISDIDKFNYLNSLLTGTAREAVAGLSLTSANYTEAVAILKKRFGDAKRIKAKHMELLMNVEAIGSSKDLRALRKLHDFIESHVRSLNGLGMDLSAYGAPLSTVLMDKLPPELQLIIKEE